MQALMLSSSKVGEQGYLEHYESWINRHFSGCQRILFIPFAGVTVTWDEYTQKVQNALASLPIVGIEDYQNPLACLHQADGVIVGGGNTFQLLAHMQATQLLTALQSAVKSRKVYCGWSAGANICGTSIKTTNDMPITQPDNFDALGFIDHQINPHYTNTHPKGFHGETRDQRLLEFCTANPNVNVFALPEGTGLRLTKNKLTFIGDTTGYIFCNQEKEPMTVDTNLDQYR